MAIEKQRTSVAVTFTWLALWISIALIGSFLIRDRAERAVATQRQHTKASLTAIIGQNENEYSTLEQNLKRSAREASARRKTELEKAWGGPLGAAFKDPAISLSEALQRAADVCAPSNSLARVSVDRFTEFAVTIDAQEALSTNQMISVARKLLPVAKEYLEALRFSTRGTLLAELDREDIRLIEDWATVADRRIVMLLPREIPARIAQDPEAIERVRQEQLIGQALADDPALRAKVQEADRDFRQASQDASAELRLALESARKAAWLQNVGSVRELDQREKDLRAAVEHARRAQEFWTNPIQAWEKVLDAQGVEGETRAILVKGFPSMFRTDAKRTAKVFEALNGELESCRFFLHTITEHSDRWKFAGGGIAILDDNFARQFERARLQWQDDSQATEAALRAWNEAVGP